MENLSDFYIQKAVNDLRENENRKEQSIVQFHEWINKHPFIINIDIESAQIMPFLRAKKYSMDKIFESFNKSVILSKKFPKICDYSNIDRVMEYYDKGPFVVMKERDAEGRRVLVTRHKIFEDMNIGLIEGLRLSFLVKSTMNYEPETQISGMVFVNDIRDVSLKYLSLFQIDGISEISQLMGFLPIRVKQNNVLGLPTIANVMMEFFKSFINEKQRSRINLCENVDDLKKIVDLKILTDDYGGNNTVEDCLRSYRSNVIRTAGKLRKYIENVEVDDEKMKQYENEKIFDGIGSFRKLEID